MGISDGERCRRAGFNRRFALTGSLRAPLPGPPSRHPSGRSFDRAPDADFFAASRIDDQHLVVPLHQAIVDVPGFATGLEGNASWRLTCPRSEPRDSTSTTVARWTTAPSETSRKVVFLTPQVQC